MLRRRARDGAIRRPAIRTVAVLAAVGTASLAMTGCHQNVAGVSESCTAPTTMNDAFLANRSVFFRISTQPDPNDPSTTWVCYRVKPANGAEEAGRVDVNTSTSLNGPQVTTDLNSRACTGATGNLVPTPHPIEQGTILDTPYFLDAFSNVGSTWVCVEAAGLKERLLVNVPNADTPGADVNTDSAPPPPVDTTPPPVGKPSSSCAAGAYGPSTELVNAHLNNRDVFLSVAQPNQTEVHLCARVQSPSSGGGVHLGVNAAPSQIVRIDQSSDLTPCTQDVVTISTPPVSIKTTPPGQLPPSVCLNGTRYTVVTGPIPPVVTLQLDS